MEHPSPATPRALMRLCGLLRVICGASRWVIGAQTSPDPLPRQRRCLRLGRNGGIPWLSGSLVESSQDSSIGDFASSFQASRT